jgi:hypothetical protein
LISVSNHLFEEGIEGIGGIEGLDGRKEKWNSGIVERWKSKGQGAWSKE